MPDPWSSAADTGMIANDIPVCGFLVFWQHIFTRIKIWPCVDCYFNKFDQLSPFLSYKKMIVSWVVASAKCLFISLLLSLLLLHFFSDTVYMSIHSCRYIYKYLLLVQMKFKTDNLQFVKILSNCSQLQLQRLEKFWQNFKKSCYK